jgi:cell wall-associated NlpC family hydrolase
MRYYHILLLRLIKKTTQIISAMLLLLTAFTSFASENTGKFNSNKYFASDIEGITEPMLHPQFWKNKIQAEQGPLLSVAQIMRQNKRLFATSPYMNDLASHPKQISKQQLTQLISSVSNVPESDRYYSDGTKVSKQNYSDYLESLNLKNLAEQQPVQYAMVVKRTDMRSFPTHDAVFKTTESINLDRFQETALFPTEVVAILHQSSDAKWYFVKSYNYSAWVFHDAIAIGDRKRIFSYKNDDHFLIITGDKVHTTYNPYDKNTSEIQLEMGTKLSLLDKNKIPSTVGGQNTYANYVVNIPIRRENGELNFSIAMIPRNKDVHIGYLPFTKNNLIEQSFKFLGERYGWGHSFNARDCTGFVGEIYKSFGILMPRNTGQQANSKLGLNTRFSLATSSKEKREQVKNLEVGDLIYIPGHVMMFLGMQDGQPFIIHDVSGLSYYKKDGSYYKSALNGVSITPLLPLQLNQEVSYLDRISNLKKIK